jgi:hypothetical protein
MSGERAGAIHAIDRKAKTAEIFGYGEYVGDEVPVEAVNDRATYNRSHGIKNPKIVLDDGKVVYGCECQWDTEAHVRKMLAGYTVTTVDIDVVRELRLPFEYKVRSEDVLINLGGNPTTALTLYCSMAGKLPPEYTYKTSRAGPKMPTMYTCQAHALGIRRSGVATSKKEARRRANALIIRELVKSGLAAKKTCRTCGQTKYLKDYPEDPKAEDWRRDTCTECHENAARQRMELTNRVMSELTSIARPPEDRHEEAEAISHAIIEDDIPFQTKKKISTMYSQGVHVDDIATRLKLDRDTVSRLIYGG